MDDDEPTVEQRLAALEKIGRDIRVYVYVLTLVTIAICAGVWFLATRWVF